MSDPNQIDNVRSVFRQLFGNNRAEFPQVQPADIFVQPIYHAKLETMRPAILVGGRGTGKTTSLQSLTYEETYSRLEKDGLTFADQQYFGILIRINKNRVSAFQTSRGSDTEDKWFAPFSHYFNLLVCQELAKLLSWLERMTGHTMSANSIDGIKLALGIKSPDNDLLATIKSAIIELELFVNNTSTDNKPIFSMQEAPIRIFVDALQDENLLDSRTVFCCIDEYENLLDYQQAITNTYIKHATPPLSYKIGVRKNGIRTYKTLDDRDVLQTPDDFEQIEIEDEGFDLFANAVCNLRLKRAASLGVNVCTDYTDFLANLSFSEEAAELGAQSAANQVLAQLKEDDLNLWEFFNTKHCSETYFLKYWNEKEDTDITTLAKDWQNDEIKWRNRIGNHGYASLFWLSLGRKGSRIKKYYCGPKTYIALPAGNIRYFLELIDAAIGIELDGLGEHLDKELKLSPKSQTLAAKEVGTRRIHQIEGLAEQGVILKRLVLGIGRVFFELARSPAETTPEVNSFVLSDDGKEESNKKILSILTNGLGHMVFTSRIKTKESANEIKDYEYRIHPIFSAYFVISHRNKRRKIFKSDDLLSMISSPKKGITKVLGKTEYSNSENLPEQLALFAPFYDGE